MGEFWQLDSRLSKMKCSQIFNSLKDFMLSSIQTKNKLIEAHSYNATYISHCLARDLVKCVLNEGRLQRDRFSVYFRNLVIRMLRRHEILFNSIVRKTDISHKGVHQCFDSLAETVFHASNVDWGQIILFYALAGCVVLHCKEKNMLKEARNVPQYMEKYLNESVIPFVFAHGGWVSN